MKKRPDIRTLLLLITLAVPLYAQAVQVSCETFNKKALAYISYQDAELRQSPSQDSTEIVRLPFGYDVCVLSKRWSHGETWAFVQTPLEDEGRSKLKRGWVRDRSLFYLVDFKRLSHTPRRQVEIVVGDYYAVYDLKGNGQFGVSQVVAERKCRKGEHPNRYGVCETIAYIRGYLYKRGDLVLPIARDGQIYDVMYVRNWDCACHVHGEKGDNGYCAPLAAEVTSRVAESCGPTGESSVESGNITPGSS